MDVEKPIIVNDVLKSLSNSVKEFCRDKIINELKVYPTEEIILAHKTLLESLLETKSTRHARRVKNPDPVIVLLDCFQRISEADLPVFLGQHSKTEPCVLSVEPIETGVIKCNEIEEKCSEKRTDFEDLRHEQGIIKAHLCDIFLSVKELKHQMKLLAGSTSFLACKPTLIKRPLIVNSNELPKYNKNETGLARLQKLVDEEANMREINGDEDIELFKEYNSDELEDVDDYSDYYRQETCKEIVVESSNQLPMKTFGDLGPGESSIEIISDTDRDQLKNFKNSSREIILNEIVNGEENNDAKIGNSFNLITDASFSCSLCGAYFQTESQLIKHVSTHRNGIPLVCTFCNFTCITAKVMKKHLNFSHSEKIALRRRASIFKCIYCSVEYNSKELMQTHIKSHYEEKSSNCFECQICFDQFQSRQQLARHKKEEHESACPHQCNICGARFTLKLYLQNHKRSHVNVKPHPCAFCNQRFLNRSKLKLHERTHTGEKPFKCSHCDYRSSRQDNLKYHINSRHINRVTTKCLRCDTKFPTDELQNHLSLHSTLLPYQCLECNRMFKSLGGLRVHYRSSQVHNKRA